MSNHKVTARFYFSLKINSWNFRDIKYLYLISDKFNKNYVIDTIIALILLLLAY